MSLFFTLTLTHVESHSCTLSSSRSLVATHSSYFNGYATASLECFNDWDPLFTTSVACQECQDHLLSLREVVGSMHHLVYQMEWEPAGLLGGSMCARIDLAQQRRLLGMSNAC